MSTSPSPADWARQTAGASPRDSLVRITCEVWAVDGLATERFLFVRDRQEMLGGVIARFGFCRSQYSCPSWSSSVVFVVRLGASLLE